MKYVSVAALQASMSKDALGAKGAPTLRGPYDRAVGLACLKVECSPVSGIVRSIERAKVTNGKVERQQWESDLAFEGA